MRKRIPLGVLLGSMALFRFVVAALDPLAVGEGRGSVTDLYSPGSGE